MRNFSIFAILTVSAALGFVPAGLAQESPAQPSIEPAAIEALDKMAAHLRTLKEFKLTATTSRDDIIEGGQLVEVAGRTVYTVRRPSCRTAGF